MEHIRQPISILFEDELVTELFSQLLEAVGEKTQILADLSELNSTSKIVTEPQYFAQIEKSLHDQCLIVGNKEVLKGIPALSLSRPLTEEKIEEALASFLAR